MNPSNNSDAAVVDASIIVSIPSKETGMYLAAKNAFDNYANNGWEFFAPVVVVSEVLFALCHKLADGILTLTEYEKAIKH